MNKAKGSISDIGVYVFHALVVGGLFGALWRASDFFTAVAALQFFGPILVLLSIGPGMIFGQLFATVLKVCKDWFKSKKPPQASVPGQPLHTTA